MDAILAVWCLFAGGLAGFALGGYRASKAAYDRGFVDGADEERRRSRLTPEERLIAGVFGTERLRHARQAVVRHKLLPQAHADAEVERLWGKW